MARLCSQLIGPMQVTLHNQTIASLETEKTRALLAYLMVEADRLGEGFREALFRRTAGHPLFTVDLLHALQEQGALVRNPSDGAWIEGPELAWEKLPARVEAVIEGQVSRLDPHTGPSMRRV